MRLAVIADDLTGAADTALSFHRAGFAAAVTTSVGALDEIFTVCEVAGVDLGTRDLPEAVAYVAAYAAAGKSSKAGALIYKKVDSQLRGNTAAELAGTMDASPGSVAIVAPALPALGRVVRDGLLEGVAGSAVPLAPAFSRSGGGPACSVDLARLRGSRPESLAAGVAPGDAVLVDAVSDDDLELVVRFGRAVAGPVIWVGSSGLAAPLGLALRRSPPGARPARASGPRPSARVGPERGVLVVAATREPILGRQLEALVAATGATVCELSTDQARVRSWLSIERSDLGAKLAAGSVVVVCTRQGPSSGADPAFARLVAEAAGALVAACPGTDLVATGGETARYLVDALDERSCHLVAEVEPGVPLLLAPRSGALLVTKAGSFGTEATLVKAVSALRNWRAG